MSEAISTGNPRSALKRTLGLTHMVLYGLGVTVGAGIYVLIGATAGKAGMHAPLAFMLAALVMSFSALSFAELGSRLPVAASEAAYVRAGFGSEMLGSFVGLMVIAMAIISAAAIAVGSAGYIRVFLDWPEAVVIALVVAAMGAIAARGIEESVTFAGVMTLVEVGGLLILIGVGITTTEGIVARLPEVVPAAGNQQAWFGLFSAGLLTVFAFVGFEGIVNVAEEAKSPQRTVPRAILLTLVIATLLYVLVAWVALTAVGPAALASSKAPLALVFERLTGISPRVMAAIAIVATLNGVIVQLIMASRVTYGLGQQGALPAIFGSVHPATQTPLVATLAVTIMALVFALLLPLDRLAEFTSRLALVLFAFVNAALFLIKRREKEPPQGVFIAPIWVPVVGLISIVAFLVADTVVPT